MRYEIRKERIWNLKLEYIFISFNLCLLAYSLGQRV